MGAVAERMREKLTERFAPDRLEIEDDSESHRGHGGWREGGETHFNIRMTSAAFNGLSRVAAQRAVHACLQDELAGPVHALSLTLTPSATTSEPSA